MNRGLDIALNMENGLLIPLDPLTLVSERLPPFQRGDLDPILPILMPAYGRPGYLEKVFAAVEAMDGIEVCFRMLTVKV